MNTKEVCRRLNVTPKMLRIYEEQGLICPERRENNYREYSAENLLQIETIAILRYLGFSISEIKEMLRFDKTENEHLDMFYLQYKALDTQIRELQRTRNELRETINKLIGSSDRESFTDIILTDRDKRYTKINYEDLMIDWDFDEMAPDFVGRYLNEDIPYRKTIARVRGMLDEMKGRSFIDIGCGTCDLWQESNPDTKLLAVDLSLPMLLESRKKLPWVTVRLDDVLTMDPGEYDRYDVVVSTFLLHHIEPQDQFRAVDNILKLCREDGVVLIAERCFRASEAREYQNSEYFIYADELEDYLHMKQYHVDTEYTDENMVLYTIRR